MDLENLKFDITLSGTYWNKQPQYSVWLDDEIITTADCGQSQQLTSFNRSVSKGDHVLKIRLENKDQQTDTVVENGEIVKDMLLNIDDIIINDISLGNLLWDADFILDVPHSYHGKTITHLEHCVNLGWNGAYCLKFNSPFHSWLLEKL